MDAKQFLAEFGHIASAPAGIQRIRELILSLAFQGQLCPHSEKSVHSLLASIQVQRDHFVGKHRARRTINEQNEILNDRAPFAIPKHWQWVNIQTVGHAWEQKKPDKDFIYIDVSSIDNKSGRLSDSLNIINAAKAPSRARKTVRKGTVIYSTVRPYLLNIALIDREFELEPIASTAFAIVHPWDGVNGRYIYYYLHSPRFVAYVESVQIGMAYPAISDEKFYAGLIPLPPTEEQDRIVAKADELMVLCDKLEAQQQQRRVLQNNLRQTTLQAVAAATNPQELQATWSRIADNFAQLFKAPEDVGELRNLILELAVRGVLVHQDESEEPASRLLCQIEAEKQQLVQEKKINASVPLPAISPEETPYELPKGWSWVRLGSLGYILGGGTPNKSNADFWGGSIPWVSPKDMKVNYISDAQDHITELALSNSAVKAIPTGSLLMVVRGMILAHSFPVAITKSTVTINQDMKALCPYVPTITDYLLHLLKGRKGHFLGLVERSSHGTCRLETHKLLSSVVPIPPLSEQFRIVARINQLLTFCDELENQFRTKTNVAERLAVASAASMAGITSEQVAKGWILEPEPAEMRQVETA